MAETRKAYKRRLEEGFFKDFVKEPIIDIGVGRIDTYDGADPLTPDCDTWDKDNGNAELMEGVKDNSYKTVYTSHLIEHLNDAITAIRNWFRITKKGGYLIICNLGYVLANASSRLYLLLSLRQRPLTWQR